MEWDPWTIRSTAQQSARLGAEADAEVKADSAFDGLGVGLVKLADEMLKVMYEAPGLGLAAPQIGVQKQLFVYDVDDSPEILINPTIIESSGEWVYDEGCLSIPGLSVEMLRPKLVLVRGTNLDGNTVEIEADELLARLFQHEIDHLQGVLMFERMTPDQRKLALAEYRRREEQPGEIETTHLKLS